MGLFAEAARDSKDIDAEDQNKAPDPSKPADSEPEQVAVEPTPVEVPLPPKGGRRAAAENKLKEFETRLQEAETRHARELAEVSSRAERFQAELAMRPVHMVQPPAQQRQEPAEVDPDDLFRKADEALDRHDYNEWKRLERQATRLIATQAAKAHIPQQQYQAPQQQMDPQLIALMAQYPELASHPNGLRLAVIKDAELDAQGTPASPARVRAAFAAAHSQIIQGGKPNGQSRPAYDQSAAGALGGAPTSRGANAGGGVRAGSNGPVLMINADQERSLRSIAKKAGMEWDEYVTDYARSNPHLVRS
jgi:hypothetical protein